MKWFVFGIGITALIIGASGCVDSEQSQVRSPVCAPWTPTDTVPLEIQFLAVGDAGNPADGPMDLGSRSNISIGGVAYDFEIAKYETTNAQYAEFLNAQASLCSLVEVCTIENEVFVCGLQEQSDRFALYGGAAFTGITRTGEECSYVYAPKPGQESWPVQSTTFFNALRFANWYENGRPNFVPPVASDDLNLCGESLKISFKNQPPRVSGCKGPDRNNGYTGTASQTETNGTGAGLTLDTRFTAGSPWVLASIAINDPGDGYAVGDSLTIPAGSICGYPADITVPNPVCGPSTGIVCGPENPKGPNTAATIILGPEHFRTTADADTEAGSVVICPAIPLPATSTSSPLLGGETALPRSAGAKYFVPNGDEWHKAAYYNPATSSYSDFPTSSNEEPTCACPGDTGNSANCDSVLGRVSRVGAYSNAESWYGTYDQGGNLSEWTDQDAEANLICIVGEPSSPSEQRIYRGGAFHFDDRPAISYLQSTSSYNQCAIKSYQTLGFRMACDPQALPNGPCL
jgi:formylglycine-generating enzyme required for sulfatase activity